MQNEEQQKRDLLTIGEASEYLGISIDTLRRWEKKGRIEPYRSPGGHRYFNKQSLDDLFGKRYTRDEPTIRKSSKPEKNVNDISDKSAEKKNAEISTEETKDEIKIETVDTPVYGLPHWRAIKDEKYEVDIEITKTPQAENIMNRPAREVKIPEAESIKIITKEKVLTSQEAYYRQQSTSILSPTIAPSIVGSPQNQEILQKEETIPTISISLFDKSQKIKDLLENKKGYLIAAFIGVILFSLIWYLLWRNSQTVLSPVP